MGSTSSDRYSAARSTAHATSHPCFFSSLIRASRSRKRSKVSSSPDRFGSAELDRSVSVGGLGDGIQKPRRPSFIPVQYRRNFDHVALRLLGLYVGGHQIRNGLVQQCLDGTQL